MLCSLIYSISWSERCEMRGWQVRLKDSLLVGGFTSLFPRTPERVSRLIKFHHKLFSSWIEWILSLSISVKWKMREKHSANSLIFSIISTLFRYCTIIFGYYKRLSHCYPVFIGYYFSLSSLIIARILNYSTFDNV